MVTKASVMVAYFAFPPDLRQNPVNLAHKALGKCISFFAQYLKS
jgi:hypothetical protein